jgi:hypothetical protein
MYKKFINQLVNKRCYSFEGKLTNFSGVNLFEPFGIEHVGQYFGREGNCYDYHIQIGETPRTPLKECEPCEKYHSNTHSRNRKHKHVSEDEEQIIQQLKQQREKQQRWEDDVGPIDGGMN